MQNYAELSESQVQSCCSPLCWRWVASSMADAKQPSRKGRSALPRGPSGRSAVHQEDVAPAGAATPPREEITPDAEAARPPSVTNVLAESEDNDSVGAVDAEDAADVDVLEEGEQPKGDAPKLAIQEPMPRFLNAMLADSDSQQYQDKLRHEQADVRVGRPGFESFLSLTEVSCSALWGALGTVPA
jgi:hypothetical protein